MGTLDPSSLMNGANGKVGNIVFYHVDGKTYYRCCSENPKNPKTPKQLLQRYRMICAQTLFKSVKKCLLYDILNRAATLQKRRSGYHLFLKLNTNAFGEDEFIDYSLLTFAQGALQLPFNFQLVGSNSSRVELEWTNNNEQTTAKGSDRLLVAAVFPDEPFRVVMLPETETTRKDEHAVIPLDETIDGDVQLYCFFANSDLQDFSDNRYFCIRNMASGL